MGRFNLEESMKFLTTTLTAAALTLSAGAAMAACDAGEMVIKFSHVTNTDKHPKGIAATLLMERVNAEMNGTACMEVFPNSTLYTDEKALEAIACRATFSLPHLPCRCSRSSPSSTACSIFRSCSRTWTAVDAFQASDAGQATSKTRDAAARPSGAGILAQRHEADCRPACL